jgi:hypothetical protein
VPYLNALEAKKIQHIKTCLGDENTGLIFDQNETRTLAEFISSVGFSFIRIPVSPEVYGLLERYQRIFYISRITKDLIERFEGNGIEAYPCLELDGFNDSIDIFIKFPNRKFFMVSIQAIDKNTLFYSNGGIKEHQRDGLYLRGIGGSRKNFNSKNLELIPAKEKLFRQQHRNILGSSLKDAKSGIVKILAICGKEAKLTSVFPPTLAEKNESRNYYLAQKSPSIFVMLEQEIIDFIKMKTKRKN